VDYGVPCNVILNCDINKKVYDLGIKTNLGIQGFRDLGIECILLFNPSIPKSLNP
jgi:hypothetical protein